jgi:anaerobic nitric oxide reductase flavorubredoxin
MSAIQIKPDIYWIGVDDRTTDLFEGLWPITKEGVSYNTYLINDDKKVLIDLTKSLKSGEFFGNISEITDIGKINYVVVNHMEPDHTGVLRILKKLAPDIIILGSEKAKGMLESFYGIKDNVQVVSDGEELSLGSKKLKFFSTPFVHWPETIMTHETSNQILFSCDAFGSYGALGGSVFDDDCINLDFYEKEALRYYVNIVAKFSRPVLNAINKLAGIKIDVIAPSHGRIWRRRPNRIIDLYKKWAEYATGDTEVGVTLIYGSMYGNTEVMMNAVAQGIAQSGVPLEIFDAARTHVSYILPSLWTKRGVVVGAPTYETELFPPVASVLKMAVHKRILNKKVARFGSYGWSGGGQRHFEDIIKPLHWELVDSLEFNGGPTKEDLKKGIALGSHFASLVKYNKKEN